MLAAKIQICLYALALSAAPILQVGIISILQIREQRFRADRGIAKGHLINSQNSDSIPDF